MEIKAVKQIYCSHIRAEDIIVIIYEDATTECLLAKYKSCGYLECGHQCEFHSESCDDT